MRWLVADSLYCPEQWFCSHLDSYTHYLREAGEEARPVCLPLGSPDSRGLYAPDVAFILDQYEVIKCAPVDAARIKVAQVAAMCSPMPWDVRKLDGSPAYDLVLSSIPWMVDEARAKGCRAEYMPLAFDTRARVCGMGVKRERKAIFIGTVGPNHQQRTGLLKHLNGMVEVRPPAFGRAYFRELASAAVVFHCHAEWSRGYANAMRLYEASGMGCEVVSDGRWDSNWGTQIHWGYGSEYKTSAYQMLQEALSSNYPPSTAAVLTEHTYVNRIPRLIELVRSLHA